MALGDSVVRDGRHIHQFVPSEAPGFNVSHTIHSISFGEPYPSMPPNPLDTGQVMTIDMKIISMYYLLYFFIIYKLSLHLNNVILLFCLVSKIVDPDIGTGLFQYFIKVVPTTYVSESGASMSTNQYTFTERFRPLAVPGSASIIPQQQQVPVLLSLMSWLYTSSICSGGSFAWNIFCLRSVSVHS